jgi:glycine/D-amino acid oxidase-like deaminating enzyme
VQSFDVIVIGSGLAGLSVALRLAEAGKRVALVTKQRLIDGASSWAQGGIAAPVAEDDSTDDHVTDTLVAGAGLCDAAATRFVVARRSNGWFSAGCRSPGTILAASDFISLARVAIAIAASCTSMTPPAARCKQP